MKENTDKREEEEFVSQIRERSTLLKRLRGKGVLWNYIATFGVIGWMIALPTVLGAYLGRYIDTRVGGEGISWTITFILLGLAVGVYSVWRLFLYR